MADTNTTPIRTETETNEFVVQTRYSHALSDPRWHDAIATVSRPTADQVFADAKKDPAFEVRMIVRRVTTIETVIG